METLGFGVNSAGFRTRCQEFYEDISGSAGYTGPSSQKQMDNRMDFFMVIGFISGGRDAKGSVFRGAWGRGFADVRDLGFRVYRFSVLQF